MTILSIILILMGVTKLANINDKVDEAVEKLKKDKPDVFNYFNENTVRITAYCIDILLIITMLSCGLYVFCH